MLKEQERLEAKIAEIDAQIQRLPDGIFVCSRGKNCTKWYQSFGRTKQYIKKNNRELAGKLLYKKYLTFLLEELLHEKQAIELYLEHHEKEIPKSTQLMAESPEFQQLLYPHVKPNRRDLEEWMKEPYDRNLAYPEDLRVQTATGEFVRSKSEAFIYMCLVKYKIPFRYECALVIDGKIIYPDFVIRHPRTGEYFYWEHFGRMHKPDYAQDSFDKLKKYYKKGLVPGINLITTYESENHPLSMEMVEKIIEYYFL